MIPSDAGDPDRTGESEALWRRLAETAIGDRLDALDRRSADGFTIAPLYPRCRSEPNQPWRQGQAWALATRIDHPDAETANRLALLDLAGGADALVLVTKDSPYRRGFGAGEDLGLVLDAIELDFIEIRLDAGPGTLRRLGAFGRLVADRRLTSAALRVDIGYDPIGCGTRLGHVVAADDASILDLRAKAGLAGTIFLADGRPWHEAGASEAQELAAVLATAVADLRRLESYGLSRDAARQAIGCLLCADADMFLGVAKFRAMRRLWARVEAVCGLTPEPLRLHAETSWRMMTRRDPWTNVMRTVAATFAAGLGGADTIQALPFTLPLGLPDENARRLARNVQRVLLDEAHLGRVADPAAGAGAFEALTQQLCEAAWRAFQEIEREGGIERSIADGALPGRIARMAAARAEAIAHLTPGLIGTSRFASLEPPAIAVLDVPPDPPPTRNPNALSARRDAEPFEALRDRAEALPERPKIFLATLGDLATFGARATEAENFLAAAGLTTVRCQAPREAADMAVEFRDSGAKVACLCGTDAAYASQARGSIAALRAAGARRVFAVASAAVAGTDGRIGAGVDALHVLAEALDAAGG